MDALTPDVAVVAGLLFLVVAVAAWLAGESWRRAGRDDAALRAALTAGAGWGAIAVLLATRARWRAGGPLPWVGIVCAAALAIGCLLSIHRARSSE